MNRQNKLFAFLLLLVFILNANFAFAGDGTEENPYTIAEAINIKNKGKTFWAKGYIAGELNNYSNNKYFFNFTPPFSGTGCCWLLSDGKDSTAIKKCLPVGLASGEACDSLNLDWGGKFWRKEVMIYGTLVDYYATLGIKKIQEMRILSPYPLEDETLTWVDPTDPIDPTDPTEPVSKLPTYIFEDFNKIERTEAQEASSIIDVFTLQKGWFADELYNATGKVRIGSDGTKGWIQTPDMNLKANNGHFKVTFDAWDFGNKDEYKVFDVYVYKGKEHVQTYEAVIDSLQATYSFNSTWGGDSIAVVFAGKYNKKNRFYIDNVDIQTDLTVVHDSYATYIEDFNDGVKELKDPAFSTYTEGTYTGSYGKWDMQGVQMNEHPSGKPIGRKSAIIRLLDNETGPAGYMAMLQDKPNGAGEVSFFAANYGVEEGAKLYLAYSTDKGKTWINAAQDIAITGEMIKYTYTVNVEGNIRIKIGKSENSIFRACVDDIAITSYGKSSIGEVATEKLQIKRDSNGEYQVYMLQAGKTALYNASGRLVQSQQMTEGWNNLNMPADKGLYILQAGKQNAKLIK